MPKYTWNDIVTAKAGAPKEARPGDRAWIVGMSPQEERKGEYLRNFPYGVVYTIEFEDGSDAQVKEDDLILLSKNDGVV